MRRRPAAGFTYLGLIILVAVIGLTGAAALKVNSLLARAAAEEDLLEIGNQFSEALRSYAAATPPGQSTTPPTLQDLLKDPRTPNPRRHLRKIFVDPTTGKAEWGIVYLGDKVGVLGVYSLSTARPLKVANFDIRFQNMDNKERLSDWKFLMAGGDGVAPAVLTAPNSMTGAPSLFSPGQGDPAGTVNTGKNGNAGGAPTGKNGDPAAGGGKAGDAGAPPPAPPKPVDPAAAPEPVADDNTEHVEVRSDDRRQSDAPQDEPAPPEQPQEDAKDASSDTTKPAKPPPEGQRVKK